MYNEIYIAQDVSFYKLRSTMKLLARHTFRLGSRESVGYIYTYYYYNSCQPMYLISGDGTRPSASVRRHSAEN